MALPVHSGCARSWAFTTDCCCPSVRPVEERCDESCWAGSEQCKAAFVGGAKGVGVEIVTVAAMAAQAREAATHSLKYL